MHAGRKSVHAVKVLDDFVRSPQIIDNDDDTELHIEFYVKSASKRWKDWYAIFTRDLTNALPIKLVRVTQ